MSSISLFGKQCCYIYAFVLNFFDTNSMNVFLELSLLAVDILVSMGV